MGMKARARDRRPFWSLNVYYDTSKIPWGLIDEWLAKIVETASDGAGTRLDTGTRDISWYFSTEEKAQQAYERLVAVKSLYSSIRSIDVRKPRYIQ